MNGYLKIPQVVAWTAVVAILGWTGFGIFYAGRAIEKLDAFAIWVEKADKQIEKNMKMGIRHQALLEQTGLIAPREQTTFIED